jgi:hypothetical protein
MAGLFDAFPDSNIYGTPAAAAQPGAQGNGQQQPQGLLGLLMGLSKLGQSNPLGLGQTAGQPGYQLANIKPQPQPPAMGGQPVEAPNFAPPIQPRVPPFALLAQLRQKLGLPTMPQQQPQQAQGSPTAAMTDPSLLSLYG